MAAAFPARYTNAGEGFAEAPICIAAEARKRALIENLRRKRLPPLEEAKDLRCLSDEFLYTRKELAKEIGKSEFPRHPLDQTFGFARAGPEDDT